MDWLKNLGESRRSWAFRFTWETCSYLMNSTVRSEVINKSIKSKVSHSNMRVVDLVNRFVELNIANRDKKKMDSVRLALRQFASSAHLP